VLCLFGYSGVQLVLCCVCLGTVGSNLCCVVFVWVQWGPTCVVLCLFGYSGVQLVLCCIFALFFFVLCTLCYQFLWIVHLWFPLRYSITFICLIVVLVEITNYSIAIPECVFSISKLKYLVLYAFFITFTRNVFRKYSSPDQQE
jgi:hypothetical protein